MDRGVAGVWGRGGFERGWGWGGGLEGGWGL